MKSAFKLLLALVAFFSLFVISCTDDPADNPDQHVTVDAKQRALFVDITATWCGPCGSSGTPMFKNIVAANENNIIAFALHGTSSELVPYMVKNDTAFSPVYTELTKQFNWASPTDGKYYVPTYVLNGNYIARNETTCADAINALASQSPVANVGFTITKSANGVKIKHTTKFFQGASGSYYLAFYVIEDNIIHRQNTSTGYISDFEHDHVLRGVLTSTPTTPSVFGSLVASGTIAANAQYTKETSYTHTGYTLPARYTSIEPWTWDPANSYIAAVIWKSEGGKYYYVNGSIKKL